MSGEPSRGRHLAAVPTGPPDPDELLHRAGRGDETAFAALYDATSARVFGLALRVVRDPGMAEEVTQEAMVEVWRTAARFDPARGSASTGCSPSPTGARSTGSAPSGRGRPGAPAATGEVPYDAVVEQVTDKLAAQQVRRCLGRVTELQREAVTLAYYGGVTSAKSPTCWPRRCRPIKTRMRDALIRLRDCLGVSAA